jgi:hypothetical protein
MSPRVPRIGDQRADRAHDDLVGQVHRRASLDSVCSERDSGYWNANWTIVYKLDDRLKNVAKGYVRRFLKEERLHRSRYLMAVASEANRSKVDHMYTDYLIKIGKDNLNEPRSETDISEDFLNALREVVSDDVRRDRELTRMR